MEKEKLFKEIEGVSEETRAKIKNLSAFSLPTNPSERGFTPEQIKQRFYMPIVGQAVSVLTELDRMIGDVNAVIDVLGLLLAGESVGEGEEAKALEDLIRLSAQGASLKEYAEAIERRMDLLGASVEEANGLLAEANRLATLSDERCEKAKEYAMRASAAESTALDASAGATAARDRILGLSVEAVGVPYGDAPSAKKIDVGGAMKIVFCLPTGAPFKVARIFSSVAEMEASHTTDGVAVGEFVLIDTGDVEDEENARLYAKDEAGYRYITDLSGSPGIRGEDGRTPVRGVDYFTPEEKAAFVKELEDVCLGDIGAALDELNAYAQSLIEEDSE